MTDRYIHQPDRLGVGTVASGRGRDWTAQRICLRLAEEHCQAFGCAGLRYVLEVAGLVVCFGRADQTTRAKGDGF